MAVHHGLWTQYRPNRMEYRTDRTENRKIFKRPKNREDGSDFDDLLMKSIVSTHSIFSKIFERTKTYRIDRIEIRKNFQAAEKSRGWLGFWRFLDGIDRLDAIYLFKNFRTNEKLSNRSNRSIGSVDRSIVSIDGRLGKQGTSRLERGTVDEILHHTCLLSLSSITAPRLPNR